MRFLELDDFLQCIDDKALNTVAGTDECKVLSAERTAMDEAAGYLADKYSIKLLYELEGNDRPAKLISILCDIALYHLICSLPGRMGYDIRKERYDLAIEWLSRVQAGKVVPAGFPTKADEIAAGGNTGDPGNTGSIADIGTVSMHSEKRNNFIW